MEGMKCCISQGNRHSNLLYCGTVYTQMIRIVVGSDCVFVQYFARSNPMGREQ